MTKIDIFSGFLGAGKTTLIRKLIKEAYAGEKLVLVENEFGEIGIDGGFMAEAGIEVTEINSGCICCSLTGDFKAALQEVVDRYHPERVLIEPSGVGKLSDVVAAVEKVENGEMQINALVTVVDAGKAKVYLKNFGEFFSNQVENSRCIVLSRTAGMDQAKLDKCLELLREHNPDAVIITTPWEELSGAQILSAMEQRDTLAAALEAMEAAHHHDDDDDDDDECCCHHHDDDDDGDGEQEHHHHHHHDDGGECHCHDEDDDDDDDDGHEHHHHHEDGEECHCRDHEHHHHHHHGHDADEVFTSWGLETAHRFTEEELRGKLEALDENARYGDVLRSKGIVASDEGQWFHFDYTPGEIDIRRGAAGVTGRLCVIGAHLNESAVAGLFR